MSDELKTFEQDRPDIVQLAGIGLTAVFLLVALVFFMQGLYYREAARQELRKMAPSTEYQQLHQEQLQALSSYRYIKKRRKIVGIPIEIAMKQLIEEEGK